MKTAMIILGMIVCFFPMIFAIIPSAEWTVEPTDFWQWRACYTKWTLAGRITSCSSPVSLDEAMWWSKTKGGKLNLSERSKLLYDSEIKLR